MRDAIFVVSFGPDRIELLASSGIPIDVETIEPIGRILSFGPAIEGGAEVEIPGVTRAWIELFEDERDRVVDRLDVYGRAISSMVSGGQPLGS